MKNKGLKVQLIISFFLLLVMMFSYVFQVSGLTEEAYLIEKYQQRIRFYSQESNGLEYKFLENNSFFEVERLAVELDFEPVNNVSYIQVLGTEVVVK